MPPNTPPAPEFTPRAAIDPAGNMPQASYSAQQTGGAQLLSLADRINGVIQSRARRDDQEAQAAAAWVHGGQRLQAPDEDRRQAAVGAAARPRAWSDHGRRGIQRFVAHYHYW